MTRHRSTSFEQRGAGIRIVNPVGLHPAGPAHSDLPGGESLTNPNHLCVTRAARIARIGPNQVDRADEDGQDSAFQNPLLMSTISGTKTADQNPFGGTSVFSR